MNDDMSESKAAAETETPAPAAPGDAGSENMMDTLKARAVQLWNGDVPLARTFWLYYFLSVFVLQLLAVMTGVGFFMLIALLWAGFMVKPIWTASDKYSGEKLWAIVAKVAAVLIALGVVIRLLA